MRPYKEPQIRVVKLSPDQAILNTCMVNGGYIDGPGTINTAFCFLGGGPTVNPVCKFSVRGVSDNMLPSNETDQSPS